MRNATDVTDHELEVAARLELAKFHMDGSKYSLGHIERPMAGEALLTFNGQSEGNVFPQAQVLFCKMPGDWDVRVELTQGAKVTEPGLVLQL